MNLKYKKVNFFAMFSLQHDGFLCKNPSTLLTEWGGGNNIIIKLSRNRVKEMVYSKNNKDILIVPHYKNEPNFIKAFMLSDYNIERILNEHIE